MHGKGSYGIWALIMTAGLLVYPNAKDKIACSSLTEGHPALETHPCHSFYEGEDKGCSTQPYLFYQE